ncbi:MAG: flagellar motor switch protein FliG [Pseudomonadota bacterium]
MVSTSMRNLEGPEKAAIIMLALGEEYAAELWRMLDDEEIREISQIMSHLGQIHSDIVEKLFHEFVSRLSTTGSVVGSYEGTERLLRNLLDEERVATIMDEIRGPAGRTMWDKLGNVNESVLASFLKNEYPQTVAVVMTKVKPDHAARVLAALPEDFAQEVIMRMLRMESVQKEILDKVESTLRTEFMNNLARTNRRDAHEMIAEIFNNFDRQTENRFLTSLEERNRESAERIRALMFTFEDLGKLDPGSVQTLLRNFDKAKLALALKGASDGLRDLFFSNMSERAGKILREDMEAMGPVRLSEVDEAQMSMVVLAKDLAAKGEIMIADGNGDDELVY